MSFGLMYGNTFHDKEGDHKNSINAERYVYYLRLNTDASSNQKVEDNRKQLFKKASSVFNYRVEQGSSFLKIADYFKLLRDSEYDKEVKLLKSKFPESKFLKEYNFENWKAVSAELIRNFNRLLSFEKVFKRNFQVLTRTNQKSIMSHFRYYFDEAYKGMEDKLVDEIREAYELNKKRGGINRAIEEVLEINLPEIVRRALEIMFGKAGVEDWIRKGGPKVDQELRDAYEELLPYLRDDSSIGNDFVNSLIKHYKLDTLAKDIIKRRKNFQPKAWDMAIKNVSIKGRGGKGVTGLGAEDLQTAMGQILEDTFNGKVLHTGDTKIKPDITVVYEADIEPIEKALSGDNLGNRPEDVRAAIEVEKVMDSVTEGFLVYSNAKDYQPTFIKKQGYSAGSPITLSTWDSMMHAGFVQKGRDLIFMALQLIHGAVGMGKDEQVKAAFARAIASALFDDFKMIGRKDMGKNTIHLLNLNGIYIPLSFYFHLLHKAFYNAAQDEISKLIQVDIDLPHGIEFPRLRDERDWRRKNTGKSPWNEQSHTALDTITIEYHFFKGFKEAMQELDMIMFS